MDHKRQVIKYLTDNNWIKDESDYKEGLVVNGGVKYALDAHDVKVIVGKRTTYFFIPRKGFETYLLTGTYFATQEFEKIKQYVDNIKENGGIIK